MAKLYVKHYDIYYKDTGFTNAIIISHYRKIELKKSFVKFKDHLQSSH